MKDNREKEGFKFFKRIFGEDLSFEELENNLEEKPNKELIRFFIKNLMHFLGISAKIGKDIEQNIRLDMSPKEFFEIYVKTIFQFSQNNLEIIQQLEET